MRDRVGSPSIGNQATAQNPIYYHACICLQFVRDRVGSPSLGIQATTAGSWDVVAAWLESYPGGRRFNRGSGERQLARLPTYPAFEVR